MFLKKIPDLTDQSINSEGLCELLIILFTVAALSCSNVTRPAPNIYGV